MFGRTALFVGVLAAAVGVPYFVSKARWKGREHAIEPTVSTGSWTDAFHVAGPSPLPSRTADVSATHLPGYALELPRLTGPPITSLADLVRWEIGPEWVVENWARVSTVPGLGSERGLRGALMTGTDLHDVCGSITYYFDPQRQLQRIVMTGVAGSTEPILEWASQQLQFRPDPESGMGIYVRRIEDRVEGVLSLQPAAIVRSDRPRQRYQIFLEVRRPGSPGQLSSEATEMLKPSPADQDSTDRSARSGDRPSGGGKAPLG